MGLNKTSIHVEDIKNAIIVKNHEVDEAFLDVYNEILQMIEYDAINMDFVKPFVFISNEIYLAMMCDEKGMYDNCNATTFMSIIRLVVSFQREYLRGLSESEVISLTDETRITLSNLHALQPNEYLEFAIAEPEEEDGTIPVYRVGRCLDNVLESTLFDPGKHPEEALLERAKNIELKLNEVNQS